MNELPLIVHGFQWESHRNFPWVMCQSYVLLTGQNLTHPKAKTSDCLEKGSWSSAVSGESWQTISGARWQSQPLGIRSLSSLLLQKERNTDKQKPFEPSKLNPFYFPSCIRVSEACANNLPKTPRGGETTTTTTKLSSRKKKLQSVAWKFLIQTEFYFSHAVLFSSLNDTIDRGSHQMAWPSFVPQTAAYIITEFQ